MADDIRSGTDSPAIIDEDQPQHLDPSLAPEIASPLAPFKGQAPPAPAWFHDAVARAPERTLVPVLGANIELLTWGDRGKPGAESGARQQRPCRLVELHRALLRARFPRRRPVAVGHGSVRLAGELQLRDLRHRDLRMRSRRQAAHDAPSGSRSTSATRSAAPRPSIRRPITPSACGPASWWTPASADRRRRRKSRRGRRRNAPATYAAPFRGPVGRGGGTNRVYATLEEALTRFQFMPPQVPGNLFIADYIARRSLRPAPLPESSGPDGSGEGWTWRFDLGCGPSWTAAG